eukprot:1269045-Prymnesium_polylepis.2
MACARDFESWQASHSRASAPRKAGSCCGPGSARRCNPSWCRVRDAAPDPQRAWAPRPSATRAPARQEPLSWCSAAVLTHPVVGSPAWCSPLTRRA